MVRTLSAVVLSSLVVLGALGVGATAATGGSGDASDGAGALSVSATGEATAEPDRAVVHLAVTATAANASDATNQLAADAERLRTALENADLATEAVESTGYRLAQGDERLRGSDADASDYRAVQSFVVTLSDTDEAGALVDLAVANGADEVDGVRFGLSEERRTDLRSEAIEAAVDDARTQAETLAASTDLTITGVHSASTSSGSYRPVSVEAADAGTNVDASPVSISVSVQITYNATDA